MLTATEKEYKLRINSVIDYIAKNINSDVSLQALSEVANYSPFHLQKVFRQIVGQTPKQYIIKLKLEAALHLTVVQPHKSIHEIGMDCGFSSPATFSRAIKNYFGISPDKIRSLTPGQKTEILNKLNLNPEILSTENKEINVRIIKMQALRGIYAIAPFDDSIQIQRSFKCLEELAEANDILSSGSTFYGILTPHQGNIYKTFLSLNKDQKISGKYNVTEIKAGKYAVFKVRGDKQNTLGSLHLFFHQWLSNSGYKIGNELVGFETFSDDPANVTYSIMDREIYMPVLPL